MTEWPLRPLADVCQIRPPKAELRGRISDADPVSFVPMEDLGIDQKFVASIRVERLSDVVGSYTYFADGDVLLAKITPCFENGKLGIAKDLTNGVGFGSSEYIVFRPDPTIDREFLYYFLSRASFRQEGAARMSGAVGHKRVSKDFIEAYPIPLPPLPEQKRIVAILDEAFEGISTAAANAEKNLANARELFESYMDATFNLRDERWTKRTLRQISLEFGRGKSKHRPRNDPKLYGGPFPFIQTGDVRNCDHVILENSQSYNEIGLAQSKLWPKGTICITIAANIAETGILGFDACFPDSVIGIVVDPKKTMNEFVEYLLQSVKAQLKAEGKGSAQDNINLATFEDRQFPFPPLDQQKEVVANLNELSESIRRVEAVQGHKLNTLTELRQSILHSAFAGELTKLPAKSLQEVAAA